MYCADTALASQVDADEAEIRELRERQAQILVKAAEDAFKKRGVFFDASFYGKLEVLIMTSL